MNSLCNLPDVLEITDIKAREPKRRLTYEYRCDERLKTKNEESTRLADTGLEGGGGDGDGRKKFLFFPAPDTLTMTVPCLLGSPCLVASHYVKNKRIIIYDDA
jgi:hypothetical protein